MYVASLVTSHLILVKKIEGYVVVTNPGASIYIYYSVLQTWTDEM